MKPDATTPVTLAGENVATGEPLWFEIGGQYPIGPVPAVTLDPQRPSNYTDGWKNYTSYLYFDGAGCFSLGATWSGGSWHLGFGLGE
jgi:hypothetical protein